MEDPFSEIARLRNEEPVHYVDAMALWYVTRHVDVKRLLSDDDVATPDRRAWEFYEPAPEGTYTRWLADNNLLALEHDDHRRVRRLVTTAFTPKAIVRMESQIAEVVAEFAAPLLGRRGTVDLMEEFTDPIPNTVISRIRAATPPPAATKSGSAVWPRRSSPMHCLSPQKKWHGRVRRPWSRLGAWVREMALERQQRPQDDLISDFVSTHDIGNKT